MFMSPDTPNSYVKILKLNVTVLGGRCLGHEGGGLISGTSALIVFFLKKRLQRASYPFCHMRIQTEVSNQGEGPHPTMLAPTLTLPASRTTTEKYLLFINQPVCGILLEQLEWNKTSCFGKVCPQALSCQLLPFFSVITIISAPALPNPSSSNPLLYCRESGLHIHPQTLT